MLFWLLPSKLAKKHSDTHRLAVHLLKKQETGLHVGLSFQAESGRYVCVHVCMYVCFQRVGMCMLPYSEPGENLDFQ